MAKFKGKTEDADVPFLKSQYWTRGTSLSGVITRRFESEPEPGKKTWSFELKLSKELVIDASGLSASDKTLQGRQRLFKIVVPESAGLQMAFKASGANLPEKDDVVTITCLGTTDVGKGNPRTDFEVEVDRGK